MLRNKEFTCTYVINVKYGYFFDYYWQCLSKNLLFEKIKREWTWCWWWWGHFTLLWSAGHLQTSNYKNILLHFSFFLCLLNWLFLNISKACPSIGLLSSMWPILPLLKMPLCYNVVSIMITTTLYVMIERLASGGNRS